jgi:hypothetical protein
MRTLGFPLVCPFLLGIDELSFESTNKVVLDNCLDKIWELIGADLAVHDMLPEMILEERSTGG